MTTKTAKIRKLLSEGKTAAEIAEKLKVSRQSVYGVRYYDRKRNKTIPTTLWARIKQILWG